MSNAYPLIQSFLEYLKFEKRYSPHTIKSYESDLILFFDYLQTEYSGIALKEISHIYIRSWLASLKDEGQTAKTINRKISTLRSFFKYQIKLGAILQTPLTKIIAPKNEKLLPHFIADKDIETLFRFVEFSDDFKGKTERLLLLLFYNTGMRLSEVLQLKEKNVDVHLKALKVLGKGNKERVIPFNEELAELISDYRAAKKEIGEDGSETLLINDKKKAIAARSAYNIVHKYLSLVSTIEKRSPHVLRHTFATHLTNDGADLNAVKELLGHSSLAATQVYTHNTIEKLKNVYKKAHPKA